MDELIVPDQYPEWVPGQEILRGADDSWDGVSLRAFRYGALDVVLPPVRDYLIVAYQRGQVDMRRTLDGRVSHEQLSPGDVTLLTRAVETHWTWREPIDVAHLHLTHDFVQSVCRQMYDRDIADVRLRDELRADDPAVFRAVGIVAHEARANGPGAQLLVESVACQLAVHLLRRHTELTFREYHPDQGLPIALVRQVEEYVLTHLGRGIALQELADSVSLSRYHFARRFRQATGHNPHEFVMLKRIEKAQSLLRRTQAPLREIAADCGFTDQSHMTKQFRRRIGVTPGRFRADG
ncbi:helix-turn-helix domain-containing protein [Pseudonocardia oroxyli]|uniref:Transcriptional regulator, AraC family n=1 Tax=Pseudonocardia oroxyli TaxID=366584 RepID=A0A1G7SVD0_PSEOR|nr:AraC family transcriptional regulator [Pseudonocardia oroxyli]SDG26389.1 transcriptional regulator, AraC family [Pseudonocardia oroxyli]